MNALKQAFAPLAKILGDETFLGVLAVLAIRAIVVNVPELAGEQGNFTNILTLALVGLLVYRETLPQLIDKIVRALADTYDFAEQVEILINKARAQGYEIKPELASILTGVAGMVDVTFESPNATADDIANAIETELSRPKAGKLTA